MPQTTPLPPAPRVVARFALWRRGTARVVLVLLAMLIAYGAAVPGPRQIVSPRPANPDVGDVALQRAILARMQAGQAYYPAAAAEQRARHYPLTPFVTMRLPTMAALETALGDNTLVTLQVLAVLATIAMVLRIRDAGGSIGVTAAVTVLASLGTAFPGSIPLFHEAWAALLLLLALATWSRQTWGVSVALGVLAALMRELAIPFLVVMALLALRDRQRTEAAAWATGLAIVGIVLALHAVQVARVRMPGDLVSPGWVVRGGWPFVVTMVRDSTVLLFVPRVFTAVLLPLSLLGWWHLRHPLAARAACFLALFLGMCLVVGRPDNTYWGILPGPFLMVGLVFAPSAVYSLWRRARH